MRHVTKKYVDKKLVFRVRLLFLIFVVLFGIVIFETAEGRGDILFTLISFLIGVVVGFLVGRIFSIKWHEDVNKVVSSIDRVGIAIIILYILFSLVRHQVLGQLFHGEDLTLLSLSLISGIMFGRVFSALRNIRKILVHKKLLA
jgi:hypothetical protein